MKPFGFNLSIDKFQSYDKIKILKQIWATNAKNPKALNAMTYICIGYDIYEPIIWNGVLRQMVTLHMDVDLMAIIDKISINSKLFYSGGLTCAYDYLIRLPFKNIIKLRSIEQDEAMCKALFMLQSCPVKHKLNLIDLTESCISLEQPHIASIFIALIDAGKEHKVHQVRENEDSTVLSYNFLF